MTSLGAAPHQEGLVSEIILPTTGPVFTSWDGLSCLSKTGFSLSFFVLWKLCAGKDTETFDDDTAIRLLIEIFSII